MILAFVVMSLTATALPLLPGIEDTIPLDLFNRRGAVTIYGAFLVAFFLFCFPLFVRRPEDGRTVRPWWWVGIYVLGFAFVPLFVLAYIAGVSRDAVFAILLWGLIAQGVVLLALRLLKYRFRQGLVAALSLLFVFWPWVGFLREMMTADGAVLNGGWTPFPSIMGMTRDLETPPLTALVIATIALQGLLAARHAMARRRAAMAGVVIVGLVACMGGHWLASDGASASVQASAQSLTHSEYWVEGRPFPIRVQSDSVADVEIGVAGRVTYRWRNAAGQGRWTYPMLLDSSDAITVTHVGGRQEVIQPRQLPSDQRLVLELAGQSPTALSSVWQRRSEVRVMRLKASEAPDDVRGYLSASVVLLTQQTWRTLSATVHSSLEAYAARGGVLFVGLANRSQARVEGEGRVIWSTEPNPPEGLSLPSRSTRGLEQNLYSNFAMPDWGRVDLSGLLIFLCLYHVLFFLIFLLPLAFDARKSMTVYLISVGCVLGVFVASSHVAVGRLFLARTQILQQDVALFVAHGSSQVMVGRQITCFASFNGETAAIELSGRPSAELVYGGVAQRVGDVLVWENAGAQTLLGPPLDRFQKKQVVRLTDVHPTCLQPTWEREGVLLLNPVEGALDHWGLGTARRIGGFVRRGGHLYPIQLSGDRLIVSSRPSERSWLGVDPERLQEENGISFIQHLLGRYVPDRGALLVLFVEGTTPLHESSEYLDRREICTLLVFPLPQP